MRPYETHKSLQNEIFSFHIKFNSINGWNWRMYYMFQFDWKFSRRVYEDSQNIAFFEISLQTKTFRIQKH